ncbi:MAG: DUF2891 domain-containing protein [Betaproteobacteria bacterium]
MSRLDAATAARLARIALANVARPYPHKLDHLLTSAAEVIDHRRAHPAFCGSYDWHSAVHMHWSLARIHKLFPSPEIAACLDSHLTVPRIAAELAYFRSPAGRTFERPYGWAWLLELQAELLRLGERRWTDAMQPLAAELADRMADFLSGAPYPIRAGTHGNSAFACLLGLDYARTVGDAKLHSKIKTTSLRWYGADCDAPLAYEPSLDDFLSPALVEAVLMQEVLAPREFGAWQQGFLSAEAVEKLSPPVVAERSDPKQSHLDGLCLSRAWCLRKLGYARAAQRHLEAGLPHVSGGDYVGEHWLASFAVLALGEQP